MSKIDYTEKDLEVYWGGTYIGSREDDGTITPLKVTGASTMDGIPVFVVNNETLLDPNRPDLLLGPAPCGMISVNGVPRYLTRRGARQWKRGTRMQQYTEIPLAFTHRCGLQRLRCQEVTQLFNGVEVEYVTALETAMGNEASILSRDFGIKLSHDYQLPFLCFRGREIGVCKESKVEIFKDASFLVDRFKEQVGYRYEIQD